MSPGRIRLIFPGGKQGRIVKPDHVRYHEARAARELEAGSTASCATAARAHLKLSALHLERARLLGALEAKPVADK